MRKEHLPVLLGSFLMVSALYGDQAISHAVDVSAKSTPLSPQAKPMQTGSFEPNWKSLEQYQVPEWYRDAKFGIWAIPNPPCSCAVDRAAASPAHRA